MNPPSTAPLRIPTPRSWNGSSSARKAMVIGSTPFLLSFTPTLTYVASYIKGPRTQTKTIHLQLSSSRRRLKTLHLATPLTIINHVLPAFFQGGRWLVLPSLSCLELFSTGCQGTNEDLQLAEAAGKYCLDILTAHRRKGYNVEVFRVSSCLLKGGYCQKYVDIGVNVEAISCSGCS